MLDDKPRLRFKPNIAPNLDYADELFCRTSCLNDKISENVQQPFIKYKKYFDEKIKIFPVEEKHCYLILQPKANFQGSKSFFVTFDGFDHF